MERVLSETEMKEFRGTVLAAEAEEAFAFFLTRLSAALRDHVGGGLHVRIPRQPDGEFGDKTERGFISDASLLIELCEDPTGREDAKGEHGDMLRLLGRPMNWADPRWTSVLGECVRLVNARDRKGGYDGLADGLWIQWGGWSKPRDVRRLQVVRR